MQDLFPGPARDLTKAIGGASVLNGAAKHAVDDSREDPMRQYVVALTLMLAPLYAQAQQPQDAPGQGMGMRGGVAAAMLAEREALQLTADQVAKLEAIRDQQQEQFAAARARMQQHMPERPQLTPEERAARRAEMQQRREQMTPEQRAELRSQMRERRAQVSPEQREAMRTEMEAVREQARASAEAARAVLTDEQRAKWDELVEARKQERMEQRPRRGERRGDRPMRMRRGMQGTLR